MAITSSQQDNNEGTESVSSPIPLEVLKWHKDSGSSSSPLDLPSSSLQNFKEMHQNHPNYQKRS